MPDPATSDEWLNLAAQHEASARLLATRPITAGQSLFHVGLAAEAVLKAYIARKERLDGWPPRAERPDLYTHDLRRLFVIAEITLDAAAPTASAWHTILQWDRGQGYDPSDMPAVVVASWIDAAFGRDGIVTWIRQLCL